MGFTDTEVEAFSKRWHKPKATVHKRLSNRVEAERKRAARESEKQRKIAQRVAKQLARVVRIGNYYSYR